MIHSSPICLHHAIPGMISFFALPLTPSANLPLITMSRQPFVPLHPRPNRPYVDIATIQNALNQNHFIDLLSTLTPHHPYKPDTSLPNYNPAGAYAFRMQKLSSEYKRQVAFALACALPPDSLTPITPSTQQSSSTLAAIANRSPVIVGALLSDQNLCVNACIPFLIRADVANQLFPHLITAGHADYIPLAVKRRPLYKTGPVLRGKCLPRVQAQSWLWNHLLAATLGTQVPYSLIIGLNPRRNHPIAFGGLAKSPESPVFDSQTWSIARIPMSDSHASVALDALQWRIDVVDKGVQWIHRAEAAGKSKGLCALGETTQDKRMRPNMKCASMYDWPWAHAKKSIALQLCELTLVSGISQKVTAEAMKRGLPNNYTDDRITAKALGIDSQFTSITLTKSKLSYAGPPITPVLIPHNRFNWRALENFNAKNFQKFDKNDLKLPRAEERSFYVDFELASPEYLFSEFYLDDEEVVSGVLDLQPSRPVQGDVTSESLIFMIGCGQFVNGEWVHEVFVADGISKADESAVVRKWLEHMDRLNPSDFGNPFMFVWGPEHQLLKKALRRMTPEDREAVEDIRHFKLVNMLQVVSTACLSIRGALNNSVKTVATALEKLGLLNDFDGRPTANIVQDGADAMALALDAVEYVKKNGMNGLADAPNMKLIASYNEADCRDITRIVAYLRKHH